LFPTLLGAAGVDAARFVHRGIDLLGDEVPRDSIFSEYYYPRQGLAQFTQTELEAQADKIAPFKRRLRAVQRYGFRLIWSSDGRHELFDLRSDPAETRNLLLPAHRSEVAEEFLGMLAAELVVYAPLSWAEEVSVSADGRSRGVNEASDETLEALRAVGYLR
jgi:hypothetical protein